MPLKNDCVGTRCPQNAELPNLIKANLNGTSLFIEEPYKAQKLKSTDYQMTGIVTHVKSGKGEGSDTQRRANFVVR
ncbi:MAG: hypothetical protein IPN94_24235 [Sphingobacteriales bacterium]|nr:hypothetical protein [Sphingobacteriales bacterium]